MPNQLIVVGITAGLLFVNVLVIAVILKAFYRKPPPGHALIISRLQGRIFVTYTGSLVYPVTHRAHTVSLQPLRVALPEALRARTGHSHLSLQVTANEPAIINFAQRFGEQRPDQIAASLGDLIAIPADADAIQILTERLHEYGLERAGMRTDTP